MPSEWEVKRPSETCSLCARAFAVGESYRSALLDLGTQFERRDFCLPCWEREKPATFSSWQTRRPKPDEERQRLADDDVILNFFHRLEGQTEPLRINFRYIVALILMRKRILKFETTEREDDRDYWVLRLVRDGTRHRVINPRLTDEEVERLSEEVGQLLNTDTGA